MEAGDILKLVGEFGPGLTIGALGLWFGFKKDAQCTTLANELRDIARSVAVTNAQLIASIDSMREVIRGTRP